MKLGSCIALLSDNQPTVHWAQRMASKSSVVTGKLPRALTLRMKLKEVEPLTTLYKEKYRLGHTLHVVWQQEKVALYL